MPELPDIVVYLEALEGRVLHRTLTRIRLRSPFLLRSADPPLDAIFGQPVRALQRLGKRIAFGFDGELWLVLHLMIAGRLHWYPPGKKHPEKAPLAIFEFSSGILTLTEAGTTHRASLHLVRGQAGLDAHRRNGLEIFETDEGAFAARLRDENHTVKRALTDPRLFSGIGNAYSDEILHRARLSPLVWTTRLRDEDIARLFAATKNVLEEWVVRLRADADGEFPEKVTAFRPEMAVHGRFGQPCPDCGAKVQRIRYANNETNYCPRCQTGGKILADRSLSRLLKDDWPRTLEELEG